LVIIKMMMKGKRGWIRIVEASLAILLIAGVALVTYSRDMEKEDISDYMYSIERDVLFDISRDAGMRESVLKAGLDENYKNDSLLRDYVRSQIIDAYDFSILVCAITDDSGRLVPCNMDEYVGKDVYVEDIILSSLITNETAIYEPRRVKLFVWEAG
ncbi:MAG: hypothetical protein ACP5D2_00565, partial [Candidatus Nanoarchaeia archaeon]